jgi:hypothetical protein
MDKSASNPCVAQEVVLTKVEWLIVLYRRHKNPTFEAIIRDSFRLFR